ncbi:hypothetical protein ABGT15_04440 [Flavobacterium enshiense]|uniref:hypothetical protein n=1 Tax=Flavobacterium enshiense TaxID=1341165 RepID=UPI00345D55FE
MKDNTKLIEDITKVVKYLQKEHVASIPDIILGFNKYPSDFNELKYLKQIQNTLVKMGLANYQSERLNGFYDLNLTDKGYAVETLKSSFEVLNDDSTISVHNRKESMKSSVSKIHNILSNNSSKISKKPWYKDSDKIALVSLVITILALILSMIDSDTLSRFNVFSKDVSVEEPAKNIK